MLPTLSIIEQAMDVVHAFMNPTPQISWPLLNQVIGTEVWIKHENHTPIGAFKVRGGLTYFDQLVKMDKPVSGVITATKGNHGQSVGLVARSRGLTSVIVVPKGNSIEKNAAMRALGVELVEYGDDFQASLEHSERLAEERGLHKIPPFHPWLLAGVSTYGYEFFQAIPDLDVVYVPVGMGSGICSLIAVKEALGLKMDIVGVVSRSAPAYARSFDAKQVLESVVTTRIADGLACRKPDTHALDIILRGAIRIMEVSDDEVEEAMRTLFVCTHNLSEGAGAAATAAAILEKSQLKGKKAGVILSGGNIDMSVFARVINTTVKYQARPDS